MLCRSKSIGFIAVLVILVNDGVAESIKLPSGVQKCKANEFNCVSRILADLLLRSEQFPEMKVPQKDPFDWSQVPTTYNTRNPNAPLTFKLRLFNETLYGMRDMQVTGIRASKTSADTQVMEIKLFIPKLISLGDYKAVVKFLSLPIPGQGTSNITWKNMLVKTKVETKFLMRDGEQFFNVQKVTIDISTSKMWFEIVNILGDPLINAAMNQVVNENWKEFFTEMKPDLDGNINDVVDKLVRPILDRIPVNEFFEK